MLNSNTLDLSLIGAEKLKTPINYAYIYQNSENVKDALYNVDPHSIWVIVDGTSSWDGTGEGTTDPDDITIGKIIKNYKSLGVGTSSGSSKTDLSDGMGAITYAYEEDGITKTVKFSRAEAVDCYIKLTLSWKEDVDEEIKLTMLESIKNSIINYVNTLGISNNVLFSGVTSAIFNVYKESGYSEYLFDLVDLKIGGTTNPTDTRLPIKIYQFAKTDETKITIA